MSSRKHLLSRLRLVGIVAGAVVLADVAMLVADAGHFERLLIAAAVFLMTLIAAMVIRHRARFGLRTFLLMVPLVAVLATLAGRYGQQLYQQRMTADSLAAIGGSYSAGKLHRQHGLVAFGSYWLPGAFVDLIGEQAFHEIHSATIPVQSLRGQRVESWKLEGISAFVLENENDKPWPRDELRVLLSAPDLQYVRVAPANRVQLQALRAAADGLQARLILQSPAMFEDGELDAEMLRVLQELEVADLQLELSGADISQQAAAEIRQLPSLSHLRLVNCGIPATAMQHLATVPNLVVISPVPGMSVASLEAALHAPDVELRACTIVRGTAGTAVDFSGAKVERLHLSSLRCPPDILAEVFKIRSLQSVQVLFAPLTKEMLESIAENESIREASLPSSGFSRSEMDAVFRDADPVGHDAGPTWRWERQADETYRRLRIE